MLRHGIAAMFSSVWTDLRFGVRNLRRNPGFALTAVFAIALGVGINTGVFSVLNALLLRDLPVPKPEQLVSIHQQFEGVKNRTVHGARRMFSTSEYRSYRDRTRTLSGLMAYTYAWAAALGVESPQEIQGKLVTCNYFDVLWQRQALGVGFTRANCDAEGAGPVVVLSHDLWVRSFKADPEMIGKNVTLNGQQFAVVGITPEGFHGTELENPAFFAPLSAQRVLSPGEDYYGNDHLSWLMLMGRTNDGASLEQVRMDLSVAAAQIDRLEPPRSTVIHVERATLFYMPDGRNLVLSAGALLMAAFGLVLLISCANVANLLLARANGRSKEIAVRLCLGASRARLIQQLLIESLLVAAAGGVLGSLLTLWSFRGLATFVLSSLPENIPPLTLDPSPDLRVLGFALALTFATGLLFGLGPALQASKADSNSALKGDGAGPGRTAHRVRSVLVGFQVAVCLMLMIAAGLLIRGLYATQTVSPGFDYQNVSVATFDLRRPGENAQRASAFAQQLSARIAALPGVESVAQLDRTPLSPGRSETEFRLPGEQEWRVVDFNIVSAEYFSLIKIPIVRGRTFTAADVQGLSHVVIVTERTARRYWPGKDPVGQFISMRGPKQETPFEVVGVAKDAQLSRIGEIDSNYLYLPATPRAQTRLCLLVRSRTELSVLAAGIRARSLELDPRLTARVNRLEKNLDIWRSMSSLVSTLSGLVAGLALVLASIGVYGVVSYAVTRRLRELGIRMALGATGGDVQRMILRQEIRPVLIGSVIGIAASTAVSQVLKSVLFGVSAIDPVAFIGAAFVLLVIATVTILIPVRQAIRVDPMTTLRLE
jgi:predicted permease